MAGLLDFVAGFGVGALGGLAEQKKANLEQKRQLNLAKLKAEYAAEIQAKQKEKEIERRKQLMDAGDYRGAIIAGESEVAEALKPVEAPEIKAADLINVVGRDGIERTVNINTPGILDQIQSGELVRVATQKASERYTEYKTELGNTIRVDTQTGQKQIQIGNDFVPYTGLEQEFGIISKGQENLQSKGGFTAEDYLRADITNKGGGIVDTLAPKLAGTPLIGEAATALIDENLGKEQKLAARVLQRLSNQILSEEAQKLLGDTESPRLTNLMLDLAEKAASLDKGLFSTPQSIANSVAAAQDILINEIALKREIAVSPRASSDQRVAARAFLTTFEPVSESFENILDVHFVRNVTAPTASGTQKNLRDFTKADVRAAYQAALNGNIQYDPIQNAGLFRLARLYGL